MMSPGSKVQLDLFLNIELRGYKLGDEYLCCIFHLNLIYKVHLERQEIKQLEWSRYSSAIERDLMHEKDLASCLFFGI